MKRFNQMTEEQMSRVDGGFAVGVLAAMVAGTVIAAAAVVGATIGIIEAVKDK